jgi:hypothetical protein
MAGGTPSGFWRALKNMDMGISWILPTSDGVERILMKFHESIMGI